MTLTDTNTIDSYHRDGYVVVRSLFSPAEIQTLASHFTQIAAGPPIENHWAPMREDSDPLRRYPRIVQPHRFDPLSKQMLLDPRVMDIVAAIFDDNPLAVQSMYYFKPPGAKGQALHQDDFYLHTKPSPCLAAWTAVDPSLPENGGLYVVPLTHDHDVVCPDMANPDESFTTHYVAPPQGSEALPLRLNPGDTLFFNGCVIHGSKPNTTDNLWRRSFICHYVPASTEKLAVWFQPVIDRDGRNHQLGIADDGGPCGREFPAFFSDADVRTKPKA